MNKLTTKELSAAAARGSPPYGKPGEVADPEYGAKAEPEEERPSPELKVGQECRARDTDGWKRKP